MKKRSKVFLFVGLAVASVGAVFIFKANAAELCPIEIPSGYFFKNYQASESSAQMARHIKAHPSRATVFTRAYWTYEGKGSLESAKPKLLAHLQKQGRWKAELTSPDLAIITDDKGNSIFMFGFYEQGRPSGTRHAVRISNQAKGAGLYEKFLALLPSGMLDRLPKSPSKPTLSR
jgi:hypothetical protein